MSELINPQRGRKDFRHQLLAGVSVIALVSLYSASTVAIAAEDAGRPTVWLELGAQSEQMNGLADPLSPPFGATVVSDGFRSPLELQRALSQSFGEQGMISYQPENSSWVFSLSARYGKAQGGATTHDQTPGAPKAVYAGTYHFYRTPFIQRYADTHVRNTEAHVIVDFQVGKDVGLGLLQHGGATLGFGLRFAQFTSKQVLNLNADPDYTMPANLYLSRFHHA